MVSPYIDHFEMNSSISISLLQPAGPVSELKGKYNTLQLYNLGMDRRKIGVLIFALVALTGGVVAAQFDLVTDSTMLVGLAIGMGAMGVGAYQQRATSD